MARKSLGEMFGEFNREAAVLVFVFGHLEQILRKNGLDGVDLETTLIVWLFTIVFFGWGLYLERKYGGNNHG